MKPDSQIEILFNSTKDYRDLPQDKLIQIMTAEATLYDQILEKFYSENPKIAEFLNLLTEKQFLASSKYQEKEKEFFAQNPAFKTKKYQAEVFEKIRHLIPEGQQISCHGGFAVLKTEKQHGRSPKGTFPVFNKETKDVDDFEYTHGSVSSDHYDEIKNLFVNHLTEKEKLFESNRFVGQAELAIPVKVISDKVGHIAFASNMFRLDEDSSQTKQLPWIIFVSPSFLHPDQKKFSGGVFRFINYHTREILIGGTGYRGEVKKGMFGIANHLYPLLGHLSFHCSSVYDPKQKEVTLIFGLSGTGKSTIAAGMEGGQTLSDDETGINLQIGKCFNLENGNYYKTGGLLKEPRVLEALENPVLGDVALYENVVVAPNKRVVLAADPTQNGRVSISLKSIKDSIHGGMYPAPKRMIILSRDVNAILDPINLLTKEQIIFYLILGYTSKTPGTEAGVKKPIPTFSKWEGGPFYDLKDEIVMKVLFKFLNQFPVEGALLNSGEGGGPFGSDHNARFEVEITLALARAFMDGTLSKELKEKPEEFEKNKILRTLRPKTISGLPVNVNAILNAKALWEKNGHKNYDELAKKLVGEFKKHVKKSLENMPAANKKAILAGGPKT